MLDDKDEFDKGILTLEEVNLCLERAEYSLAFCDQSDKQKDLRKIIKALREIKCDLEAGQYHTF